MARIYQIGKVNSKQGAFYVIEDSFEGKPYFEVYFKRTGEDPEHYLYDGFNTAKEACMCVDKLVAKWLV